MKRVIVFFLAVMMVLTISACGGKEASAPGTEKDAPKTTETESPKTEEKNDLLEWTYKVPLQKIYIDVPAYQEIEEGYTELFIIHDSRYVAVTSAYDDTANSPREAHEFTAKKLILNMQNHSGGINSINITKGKDVTINGIDMYMFEGTINYGRDVKFDGYAKGYAFILDGIPCEIVGSVVDESQDQKLIDEIDEIITAMAKTVRSEE